MCESLKLKNDDNNKILIKEIKFHLPIPYNYYIICARNLGEQNFH